MQPVGQRWAPVGTVTRQFICTQIPLLILFRGSILPRIIDPVPTLQWSFRETVNMSVCTECMRWRAKRKLVFAFGRARGGWGRG